MSPIARFCRNDTPRRPMLACQAATPVSQSYAATASATIASCSSWVIPSGNPNGTMGLPFPLAFARRAASSDVPSHS